MKFSTVIVSAVVAGAAARREMSTFDIDLDLPPSERYLKLLPQFNGTVWKFYNDHFASNKTLTDALYAIALKRGPEPTEMQEEIRGLSKASKLPFEFVKAIQMLYELQTLMVPVENVTAADAQRLENFTQYSLPAGFEALAHLPWRGPGCTGIIAVDSTDGSVNHARNLDFSPVPIMTNLAYTGIFKKGGKEIFRSQMIAGYCPIVTGMVMGPDGYTLERNTRYADHEGGNDEMFKNLFSGRPLNGWALRKVMETTTTYDAAVAAVAAVPYVSTEYAIMSGVKKGTIMSRNPDDVAYTQTLGQANFDERDDYIIMTNFDLYSAPSTKPCTASRIQSLTLTYSVSTASTTTSVSTSTQPVGRSGSRAASPPRRS